MVPRTYESLVDEFITTYRTLIHRDGAEELLEYLCNSSNFFLDPASTKYHLCKRGGLIEHSLVVFHRLKWLCAIDPLGSRSPDEESIAIVSLLHDLCKADTYIEQSDGTYKKHDKFPFGHGEKSVYLISKYMKLTDAEAIAIRYHMGSWNEWEKSDAGTVFQHFPLAFFLHVADEYATFVDEVEE